MFDNLVYFSPRELSVVESRPQGEFKLYMFWTSLILCLFSSSLCTQDKDILSYHKIKLLYSFFNSITYQKTYRNVFYFKSCIITYLHSVRCTQSFFFVLKMVYNK